MVLEGLIFIIYGGWIMYDEEELKKFKEAGKVAADVREKSKKLIKVGASLLEVAEKIESWVLEEVGLAFPVNISINEVASHYTPSAKEERVFTEKDLVSIDIGTQVDGYVGGDTAYSIDLTGEWGKLVEASEEALNTALSSIKAGAKTSEIGEKVEKTIENFGFKPIKNLSGHSLGKYVVHGEPPIPSVKIPERDVLEEGMVLAIEPFASTGDGLVREGSRIDIFSYEKDVLTRNMNAREILGYIKEERKTLPFCERWLAKKYQEFMLKIALRELVSREALISYPVLKDKNKSFVSQTEKSIIVEKDSCVVIT